jgi:hypothetical protein
MPGVPQPPPAFDPKTATKPHPALFTYYFVTCVCTIVLWPFLLPYYYFRYHTLTYRFDEEGVHMAWGILFRTEINLTYRRIQDINVTRGILQRWLGLANVTIQTASASSAAMVIEGIPDYQGLRDFLYLRMRGARGDTPPDSPAQTAAPARDDQLASALRDVRDELAALREDLRRSRGGSQ